MVAQWHTSVSFSSAPFTKSGLGTDRSWTPKGGFDPGLYEVRVALANTLQFTANFWSNSPMSEGVLVIGAANLDIKGRLFHSPVPRSSNAAAI